MTDVALMCAYRHPAFDSVLGTPAAWTSPRLPTPEQLADHYSAASGRDLEHWGFFLGLAYLKIAVIAEGITFRARQGAGADETAVRAADAVPDLVAAGRDALARPW